MDGNGRWARSRGLPRLAGHRAGTENLRRIIQACVEFGIQYLTMYAFSTENWTRPPDEVQGLMHIFEDVLERELQELDDQGVQLRHIGRLEKLSPSFREKVLHAIEMTRDNSRLILNIAFNYGGRDEIVYAIQRMMKEGVKPEEVNEAMVCQIPFHSRHARSGPDHPHLGGNARQQFPALAGVLLGMVFPRGVLAGFRQRAAAPAPWRNSTAATAATGG